jgi:flagellar basal body-associated protein FliL
MKKRKILKTLLAAAMVLALGVGAVALAFHSHHDNKVHPDCAVCYAQRVLSTVVLCLAPIIAIRRAFSVTVARPMPAAVVAPAYHPHSPRSPPCSFQLSQP